jgi:hypothetical protein
MEDTELDIAHGDGLAIIHQAVRIRRIFGAKPEGAGHLVELGQHGRIEGMDHQLRPRG